MSAASATPRLSVIVITKNEAARLPTCLSSVAFADELIVVDAGSTDGTAELARSLGARVIVTADWPGFGAQKQRALDAATGTWVLSLDADEWLDDELAAAVRQVAAGGTPALAPACYQLNRLSAFCGQWMQHGSWSPDPLPRLFQRSRARFSDDRVHERLMVDGGSGRRAARLPGRLLHNSITSLQDALTKMNHYSSGRASDLRARGRRGGVGRALGHGLWAFVRSYALRRGFLDGRLGLVLALLDAQASYYRYLKLWLGEAASAHALPPPQRP